MISPEDFFKVDIRSGTIVKAEEFPKAKKPAYKVWVDFGDQIGIKQTSAQITALYEVTELPGRKVAGVINLPIKNIAGFVSEFLLLGFEVDRKIVYLINVDLNVPNGTKLS
ncbi:MAG: csaA [Chlamydiales bacterium]|jgi:tRNA-binding protein|nr:csaA [Chlamydiales bacterium]